MCGLDGSGAGGLSNRETLLEFRLQGVAINPSFSSDLLICQSVWISHQCYQCLIVSLYYQSIIKLYRCIILYQLNF